MAKIVIRRNGYDFIQHGSIRYGHKYIDREWKNGRWVYTYPYTVNNNSNKKISGYNKSASEHTRLANIYQQKYEANKKLANDHRIKAENQRGLKTLVTKPYHNLAGKSAEKDAESAKWLNIVEKDRAAEDRKNAMKTRANMHKRNAQEAADMRAAVKRYEKTPASKIETAYHKSKDRVDSWLSKIKVKFPKLKVKRNNKVKSSNSKEYHLDKRKTAYFS